MIGAGRFASQESPRMPPTTRFDILGIGNAIVDVRGRDG